MRNRRKGEISGLEETGKEQGQEKMSRLQQRQDWQWLVRSFGLVRPKNRDLKICCWTERNWYKIKTGPGKFHPTSMTRQEEASLSSISLGEIRNHTKRGPELLQGSTYHRKGCAGRAVFPHYFSDGTLPSNEALLGMQIYNRDDELIIEQFNPLLLDPQTLSFLWNPWSSSGKYLNFVEHIVKNTDQEHAPTRMSTPCTR